MRREAENILRQYGEGILNSREFMSGFDQTHHVCTTVSDHSLGVAMVSIRMCLLLEKLHIHPQMKAVTVAALGHDLGILGRHEKYRSSTECCRMHPVDSIPVIRRLTGEENERVENAVLHHMFPLTPVPPKHLEGVVLTIADKVSSCMERAGRNPAGDLGARIAAGK